MHLSQIEANSVSNTCEIRLATSKYLTNLILFGLFDARRSRFNLIGMKSCGDVVPGHNGDPNSNGPFSA